MSACRFLSLVSVLENELENAWGEFEEGLWFLLHICFFSSPFLLCTAGKAVTQSGQLLGTQSDYESSFYFLPQRDPGKEFAWY